MSTWQKAMLVTAAALFAAAFSARGALPAPRAVTPQAMILGTSLPLQSLIRLVEDGKASIQVKSAK